MPNLKLGKLSDRTPVRLHISISPDLAAGLTSYANLHKEIYGREEALVDLIPAMLATFLDGDREFVRSRTARK